MNRSNGNHLDRRQALECMVWAGSGLVWTLNGGVPASNLIGAAEAATASFSFVQISDSHIGFNKPPIPIRARRSARRSTRSAHCRQSPPL